MTKRTRSACGACRLKKCFLFGMNPNLIRSSYNHEIRYQKPIYLSQVIRLNSYLINDLYFSSLNHLIF
jgi:hypothetical protein